MEFRKTHDDRHKRNNALVPLMDMRRLRAVSRGVSQKMRDGRPADDIHYPDSEPSNE